MLEGEKCPLTLSWKRAEKNASLLNDITQELLEDDFDRKRFFCEQMIKMYDSSVIELEQVLCSDE